MMPKKVLNFVNLVLLTGSCAAYAVLHYLRTGSEFPTDDAFAIMSVYPLIAIIVVFALALIFHRDFYSKRFFLFVPLGTSAMYIVLMLLPWPIDIYLHTAWWAAVIISAWADVFLKRKKHSAEA